MDRRLIDLEMKGFEEELGRRRQSLDILKADRMDYWLAGWKQSYAIAFEHGDANPSLSAKQCRDRLDDLGAFVADRTANEDEGTAGIFANWHGAFAHCVLAADPTGADPAAETDSGEFLRRIQLGPTQPPRRTPVTRRKCRARRSWARCRGSHAGVSSGA